MPRREKNRSIRFCATMILAGMLIASTFALWNQRIDLHAFHANWAFAVALGELKEHPYQEQTPYHLRAEHKAVFGWGGTGLLAKAIATLPPYLHNCRQYKLSEIADTNYSFEVKVESAQQHFRVAGILVGSEKNPTMAACLRKQIEKTRIAVLGDLPVIPEERYTLTLEIRSALGVDYEVFPPSH